MVPLSVRKTANPRGPRSITDPAALRALMQEFDIRPGELELEITESVLLQDTAATLAKLHQVDFEAVGLGDYGRPGNYFDRQVARWTKQYKASETEHIPEIERLIAELPRSAVFSAAPHGASAALIDDAR